MSLHHAAQHLKTQGRGPDDQLIHMSSNEVAGLQALAKAHGGTLTVNPTTGLPEAGFLDKLLPAIIGAGAVYLSGGTITPMMAGLGVGGIETARTGDLGKGIMAGIGAYGGAGALEGVAGLGEAGSGFSGQTMAENVSGGASMAAANPSAGLAAVGGKNLAMAAAPAIVDAMQPDMQAPQGSDQMIRPYEFSYNQQAVPNMIGASYQPGQDTSERMWFQPEYTALEPYKAAGGGLMAIADMAASQGGPVEQMSFENATGQNTGYPQAYMHSSPYATPWQTPVSENVVGGVSDVGVDRMSGEMTFAAGGGISTLGGYAAGGNPRLLKGPGDGMSDNIPAVIGNKQPARLADGEFVVPADVVSHLGNGSTDAGAKQLYKMMDRIRQQRTGKKKQAPEVNPKKAMPA
jgi:hypothetical protein